MSPYASFNIDVILRFSVFPHIWHFHRFVSGLQVSMFCFLLIGVFGTPMLVILSQCVLMPLFSWFSFCIVFFIMAVEVEVFL